MPKKKKRSKKAQKGVDRFSEKARLGRPRIVGRSEAESRAYDYTLTFEQSWDSVKVALLRAKTESGFKKALEKAPYHVRDKFPPRLFPFIRKIRQDPKFPKTERAQKRFFAESLAGGGRISPRSSRDLCADLQKNPIHIIKRRDYYIECTCGYEGPAKYGRCPGCGTSRTAPQVPSIFDPDDY